MKDTIVGLTFLTSIVLLFLFAVTRVEALPSQCTTTTVNGTETKICHTYDANKGAYDTHTEYNYNQQEEYDQASRNQ
jgi:hypothetical protein